jgi:hypothetical protein
MKKNLTFLFSMIVVLCGLSFTSSAQDYFQPCNAISHPLFEPAPVGKSPVKLNRLGTSPQFGEINGHTAEAAYSHLKGIYSKNSARNKREVDNLLQAMGYTGFNDPSFSTASITPETLPAGTTGWMGAYSRGHKYAWSVLGRAFRTFKISSTDGQCYVYIMRKCGNAFYDPSIRILPPPVTAFVPEVECLTQQITISGNSKIEKTNFVNTTADVQLVATNGANPSLCLGSATVPVSAQYGISANGSIDYSKVVEVCTYGTNNIPAPINMASPVQLMVDVTESNVMLGDGGKMMMAVSDDQYKQMKKLYSTCTTSEGSMNEAPTYTKEETGNMVESTTAMTTGSGTDCKTQTMTFMGNSAVSDGAVKTASKQVTVIGKYMKTGSLTKGESADKYLCLGTYPMNASLASAFNVSGTSKTMKSLEICDKDGNAPATMDVNVPIKLGYSLSNPTMSMGDSDRIFINLDATQYKTLSKRFGRCCGVEGNDKCI